MRTLGFFEILFMSKVPCAGTPVLRVELLAQRESHTYCSLRAFRTCATTIHNAESYRHRSYRYAVRAFDNFFVAGMRAYTQYNMYLLGYMYDLPGGGCILL
jgi:hypothetical protein